MPKVRFSADEWWPCLSVRSEEDHYAEALSEVPARTLARWEKASKAWEEVQEEMKAIYEKNGGTAR